MKLAKIINFSDYTPKLVKNRDLKRSAWKLILAITCKEKYKQALQVYRK